MNITVFGSNGRVGQKVVEILRSEDYNVTAFVHGQSPFEANPKLQIAIGDIRDQQSVDTALKNSDAVISTLGSWGTATKDILSSGMAAIIPEMKKHGIKRIITVTGAGATFKTDENFSKLSRISRVFIKIFAKPILMDGEKHIELLLASNLDWTVLRSPVMKKSSKDSTYKLAMKNPLPWETVNRNNVARCLVDQLNDNSWFKQAPFIRNS